MGKFYNQHFVNAQIDMEKDEFKLVNNYNVNYLPSTFLSMEMGEMGAHGLGYMDVASLLNWEKALNCPDKQYAT